MDTKDIIIAIQLTIIALGGLFVANTIIEQNKKIKELESIIEYEKDIIINCMSFTGG
jgi:hypothetical protein